MKKKILLIAVLSLMLTACGSSGSGDYTELIEMLDKGQYEAAHAYIDGLEEHADDVIVEEKEEDKESMEQYVYGEWTSRWHEEGSEQPEKIVVNEDGTCVIGENTYTWKTEEEYDTSINFLVKEGNTELYRLVLSKYEEDYTLELSVKEGEGYIYQGSNYYNESHYDVVNITVDNFYDYFEEEKEDDFRENAFGEVESLSIYQRFVLKDEYFQKMYMTKPGVTIEASYVMQSVSAKVDFANKTYELGDDYEAQGDGSRSTSTFEGWANEDAYTIGISSCNYGDYDGRIHHITSDVKIERVIGTFLFRK